jgi:hypothetical protein
VHNNRFAKLIDSYRLATEVSPPTGYILVHNEAPEPRGDSSFKTFVHKTKFQLPCSRNLCGCQLSFLFLCKNLVPVIPVGFRNRFLTFASAIARG